jgi:hypothetical protein
MTDGTPRGSAVTGGSLRFDEQLNAMIAQVASENGAVYVDMYTPSIPYNACTSASNRWIEPAIPSNRFQAAPVHPNLRGVQGLGGILLQAIYGG